MNTPNETRAKAIWEEVKANGEKLKQCKGHDFSIDLHPDKAAVAGWKWQCKHCKGKVSAIHKVWYENGKRHGQEEQAAIDGDTSDGYHTFNELYHHRAVLFSVICNDRPGIAWKSRLHDDGTMFEGMFIVGVQTPRGQATYHYDIEPYWDLFRVQELETAPPFDGHTPAEAIGRIGDLAMQARWGLA